MKETKIEKLILDLSTRWEVSPEEAVDRLNSMNESEINKLINSMTKKFKNGGFIDCLRNGGSISKCKCGCDKITKHQETSVIGKEMPRRVDGPGRVGEEEVKENGTRVSYLTRPGDEGSTWYTEQRISPQNDTTYTAWNTATPTADLLNSPVYITPTAYKNMSKFKQMFYKVVPEGWMNAFKINGLENGGKIQKGQNGLYDLGFSFKPIGFKNKFSVPRLTFPNDSLGLSSISAQDMVKKANALRRDAEIAKTIDINNKIDNYLRKNGKNIKPWYDHSSFIGPVTIPTDVLNAGPQELMSDEEMNSRRAREKKIDDFIKSVKPMSTEQDINTQIANAKNFSQAFGLARKAGLKEFDWKGKRIAVKLKSDSPESNTQTTASKSITQNTVNNSKPQETTVVEPWRDALASGGAGSYLFAASVPGVGTDAYLDPTGQMDRRQTGYVAPEKIIERQIAATGVNPNSKQGRRMARLAKYSNIK